MDYINQQDGPIYYTYTCNKIFKAIKPNSMNMLESLILKKKKVKK